MVTTTETAAEQLEPAPSPSGETVLTRQIRYDTAIVSFAAGVLHVLAMFDHDDEPTLARAFLAVAAIQIVWAVLLLIDPRRVFVVVGALATAGAIAVWVLSRTKGISWFPGLDHVEALGWRDVVTQFFQLLALTGATILLLPAQVHEPARGRRLEVLPIALFALLVIATVAVLYAATHTGGHTH
jgi:hypothetical protein